MEAPVLYMVKVWVSPDAGGDRYCKWFDEIHVPEVIRQPGFLWAQKYCLGETDEKGWRGYVTLYGLSSGDALQRYMSSDVRRRFFEELKAYDDVHYAERCDGRLVLALEA